MDIHNYKTGAAAARRAELSSGQPGVGPECQQYEIYCQPPFWKSTIHERCQVAMIDCSAAHKQRVIMGRLFAVIYVSDSGSDRSHPLTCFIHDFDDST